MATEKCTLWGSPRSGRSAPSTGAPDGTGTPFMPRFPVPGGLRRDRPGGGCVDGLGELGTAADAVAVAPDVDHVTTQQEAGWGPETWSTPSWAKSRRGCAHSRPRRRIPVRRPAAGGLLPASATNVRGTAWGVRFATGWWHNRCPAGAVSGGSSMTEHAGKARGTLRLGSPVRCPYGLATRSEGRLRPGA